MKRFLVLLSLAVLSTLACAASEREHDFADGYALAEKKGCLECHDVGRTVIGPSYAAVARHYRFDPHARERLPYVIRGGSIGHWGDRFAMWPQPNLSDAEVEELVDWVLSQ